MQMNYVVGVDEAGRGPLAGPVAVGMVKIPVRFDWRSIEGVGDSKKVTPKKRKMVFQCAKELKAERKLDFVVLLGSAEEIDEKGIAVVIRGLVEKGLKKLKADPEEVFVRLDGALRAPSQFEQETIIKGDQKELVIGLASICAKETRDEYMLKISSQFPEYEFEVHKGYGTKVHRQLILKKGLSPEHRISYCQNRHLWGKV